MKLLVLAVGRLPKDWVFAGCAEYEQRLRVHMPVCVQELKSEEQLKSRLPPRYPLWALDESGEAWSSIEFAQQLHRARCQAHPGLALLIGGPDGHSSGLRSKADRLVSLSKLTLPHRLARLVLLEQLYRAASILGNSPYHREGQVTKK